MRLLILCAVAAVIGGEALAGGSIDGSVLGPADTYVGEPMARPPRYVHRSIGDGKASMSAASSAAAAPASTSAKALPR